jgi:hypothetical protein
LEFYRYVRRRKGNRKSLPAIKDCNGGNISDPVRKANIFNKYYDSVFSSEQDIPQISKTSVDKPFTIKISIIRK